MKQGATAIIDRMKRVTGARTDGQLASLLGIPRPTVASWKTRDSVPVEYCLEISSRYSVSLEWLITGKGQKSAYFSPHGFSIDPDLVAVSLVDLERRPKNLPMDPAAYFVMSYQKHLRMVEDGVRINGADRQALVRALRISRGLEPEKEWRELEELLRAPDAHGLL